MALKLGINDAGIPGGDVYPDSAAHAKDYGSGSGEQSARVGIKCPLNRIAEHWVAAVCILNVNAFRALNQTVRCRDFLWRILRK